MYMHMYINVSTDGKYDGRLGETVLAEVRIYLHI